MEIFFIPKIMLVLGISTNINYVVLSKQSLFVLSVVFPPNLSADDAIFRRKVWEKNLNIANFDFF